MPVLKNQRQELFAQEIAAGETQQRAYVKAGYKGNPKTAASQIFQRADVKRRVDELLDRRAKAGDITKDRINLMLLDDREGALGQHDYNTSSAIAWKLAQLNGLVIHKAEVRRVRSLEDFNDAELAALEEEGRDLGLLSDDTGGEGGSIEGTAKSDRVH